MQRPRQRLQVHAAPLLGAATAWSGAARTLTSGYAHPVARSPPSEPGPVRLPLASRGSGDRRVAALRRRPDDRSAAGATCRRRTPRWPRRWRSASSGCSPRPRSSAARRCRRSSASTPRSAGVPHCVGVANGTDALELALRAVGVGPGARGDPAGEHVHRDRRGGRPGRRPGRCWSTATRRTYLIDVEPRSPRSPRPPRRSCRCTCTASSRRWSGCAGRAGVPIVEDAAQCQGATRHGRGAGAGGHRGHELLPRQEPRRVRRRGRGRHRRRGRSPTGCGRSPATAG